MFVNFEKKKITVLEGLKNYNKVLIFLFAVEKLLPIPAKWIQSSKNYGSYVCVLLLSQIAISFFRSGVII